MMNETPPSSDILENTMSEAVANPKRKKKAIFVKKLRKALGAMPEALRDEITDIMNDVAALDSSDIQRRYDIGKRLHTMMTDDSGKYGVDAENSIKDVLRLSKDSVAGMVWAAKSFNQHDLDKLVGLANPVTNERLRWNHIVHLSRVPDKDKAFDFARRAIEQGWTTKDLGKAIIRSRGGAKSAGGRKPKSHATVEESLSDICAKMKSFSNAAESVWLAPKGISEQFDVRASDSAWTPPMDLIRQLAEACDQGNRLSVQVAAINNVLNGLKSRAETLRSIKKAKVA